MELVSGMQNPSINLMLFRPTRLHGKLTTVLASRYRSTGIACTSLECGATNAATTGHGHNRRLTQ